MLAMRSIRESSVLDAWMDENIVMAEDASRKHEASEVAHKDPGIYISSRLNQVVAVLVEWQH